MRGPTRSELDSAHTYLNMLRVPSRQANLDAIANGMRLVAALKESLADDD